MPVVIGGSGPVTGVTSINTTVSDTELGYLDGVTSAIQTQINTAGGLVKITAESLSAVSSVSINNCFSATYDNYRLIFDGTVSSDNTTLRLRWRVGGVDNSTASSYANQYVQGESTNVTAALATNDYARISNGDDSETILFSADIASPFLAKPTVYNSFGNYPLSGSPRIWFESGRHNQSTSYDGFTFYVASGTITGTIRVYGYRN